VQLVRIVCLRVLCFLVCLVLTPLAQAASVVVIASERNANYTATLEAISEELQKGGLARSDVAAIYLSDFALGELSNLHSSKLIITLGTEALKQVLFRDVRSPVLATLIPRSSLEGLVKESARKSQVSALYLDQPFGRQLDLLRLAMPNAKRVGVMWGGESIANQTALGLAAQARGLELVGGRVLADGSLSAALKAATDDTDALLAVADPAVFNSATISNILLATYRVHIPVVAFSPAYVKAGALVSLHSTPSQIGAQTGAIAQSMLSGATVPHGQYLSEFSVSVNAHVARSLGLTLDAAQLAERLRRMERRS
jgi:putative ABC transport system substrate-binding protein